MLSLAGNNVFAFRAVRVGGTFNRQIVRFGGARREDDFTRIGINQLGNLVTRHIHRLFSLPAETVRTGSRITESTVQC
ncbi:hypothetical protein SRABI106_04357 [Rahnella aquatilis]|nr:hypothetical protein SRABI106_04357 [Rahnella aquatilis]